MRPHFYLLRHGETVWNRIGRLQGQIDVPLTRLGLIQAEAMGRTLSEILETGEQSGPVRMIASPLGRTRQTAAVVAEHLGHAFDSIEMEPMLKEITLGDYDGAMGWDALDRQAPEEAAKRRDDPWNYRYPNGESSQDVQDRVRPVFEGLKDTDGVVIVVAHGVVNKIIRGLHLNLSTAETFELDRPQDAFYRLHTAGETLIPTNAPASEGGAKVL